MSDQLKQKDTHKHKAIIIRVPDEIGDRLKSEAEARGVTVTWMANKLIAEAIAAMRPAEEFSLTRKVQP